VAPARDQAACERVTNDIERLLTALKATLPRYLGSAANAATWVVYEGRILGGTTARTGWDKVFAEAQMKWHKSNTESIGVET